MHRLRLNFNSDYKFMLGDHPGAERQDIDDDQWDFVGLPHCFSTPYWGGTQFYVGYGWYRKHFEVAETWLEKRVAIEFEGAFQDTELFINGVAAGTHQGGYTGFELDVTPYLKAGENLLAIRLNNLWNAQLAPRAGEHQFAGGLYRNVWLNIFSAVHIPYCGVRLSTPKISSLSATVAAKTKVVNLSSLAKSVKLTTIVAGPHSTSSTTIVEQVGAGESHDFVQRIPIQGKPELWHPNHPTLYHVSSVLECEGRLTDSITNDIGLRWFEFTADRGFFLNGEHCLLRGANVHQDHAGWCNAVTNAGIIRDVKMVKEAGFNFIRGSHYPHSPAFYNACDHLGILVWSELCFWGIGGFGNDGDWTASAYPVDPVDQKPFEQHCRQTLVEMISQHINNPCIVAWSMCNEVFFSPNEVMPQVRSLLANLVTLSRASDPTRPAGIGGCQRGDIDKLGDIAGYNGDGARIFIDPGIASLVAEYGSCGDTRPGDFDPCWGETSDQPDFAWRSGKALWCMFDHGSNANIGKLGCVDYFRVPKRRWFWYRQHYNAIDPPTWPVPGVPAHLKLTRSAETIRNDGTEDCCLTVAIHDASGVLISNCAAVTLSVESGPGQFPTGRTLPFVPGTDIEIIDGIGRIEFRSQYPGQAVILASSPGLPDCKIPINVVGTVSRRNPEQKPLPLVLDGPITKTFRAYASSAVNVALNRPTKASSEFEIHLATSANDNNATTYWQSSSTTNSAWWQVDMENVYRLTQGDISFGFNLQWKFKIELSLDGNSWTTIEEIRDASPVSQYHADFSHLEAIGRYFRITFVDIPDHGSAKLSEVAVYGTPV